MANVEYLSICWELLVRNLHISYPAWITTLLPFQIWSKKVEPEVQICDRRANEYRVPYRLGGRWIGRKSGCRCSLERISKFYPYRHIKTKLRIKINIHLSDFWHRICQKRRIIVWKWQMKNL